MAQIMSLQQQMDMAKLLHGQGWTLYAPAKFAPRLLSKTPTMEEEFGPIPKTRSHRRAEVAREIKPMSLELDMTPVQRPKFVHFTPDETARFSKRKVTSDSLTFKVLKAVERNPGSNAGLIKNIVGQGSVTSRLSDLYMWGFVNREKHEVGVSGGSHGVYVYRMSNDGLRFIEWVEQRNA